MYGKAIFFAVQHEVRMQVGLPSPKMLWVAQEFTIILSFGVVSLLTAEERSARLSKKIRSKYLTKVQD